MKGIILHWTAGTYKPNDHERYGYHFMIDGDGKVHTGKHKPEDNLNCNDGNYAAHCGGGNTGRIGIAACGMFNPQYRIKPVQYEAMYKLCAELCKKYKIPINTTNIMTHYRFGKLNPTTSSKGKIDLMELSDETIINKVKWYFDKI